MKTVIVHVCSPKECKYVEPGFFFFWGGGVSIKGNLNK